MGFYDEWNAKRRVPSPSGRAIVPDPQEKQLPSGEKYLAYKDSNGDPYEVNFYESICSHASTVDLAAKIARAQGGDPDALKTRTGVYVDLTSAPTSMMEAHKMNLDAELKFNALPDDLKSCFGNLVGFRNSCLDGTLDSKIYEHLNKVASGKQTKDTEPAAE